jgi:hypothetical protein
MVAAGCVLVMHFPCRRVDAIGPRRVIGVAGLDSVGKGIGNFDGSIQILGGAGHIVENDQVGAEAGSLVGLQEALARHHVPIVAAGVRLGVIRVGQIRPATPDGRHAVGQPVISQENHVLFDRFIAQVAVKQVPGRKGHRDLIAAQAMRIVVIGLVDLVLQIVGHTVGTSGQRAPEIPDEPNDMIVGLRWPVAVPGQKPAGRIKANRMIPELLGRS